jgi:hypothetical protein
MCGMTFSRLVAAQLQHVLARCTPGEDAFRRTDLQAKLTLVPLLGTAVAQPRWPDASVAGRKLELS